MNVSCSFLISSNIITKSDNSANSSNNEAHSPYTSNQYLNSKLKLSAATAANASSLSRQGPFKEVKSLIADFRQKNPDILPRVGKRIKLNEHTFRNLNKSSSNVSAII